MRKVLSALAISAFVLTAGSALAGGPGKMQQPVAGCPDECQQQIDDLQGSQAQQNERLGGHDKQLQDHEIILKRNKDKLHKMQEMSENKNVKIYHWFRQNVIDNKIRINKE